MSAKPQLVLLHGWGIGRAVWDSLLPALQPHFSIAVLDLPGYGARRNALPFDLPGCLDWLRERIPPGSHALGWSLGGNLLCELALADQHHLASLVTVAANPSFLARDDWPGLPPTQLRQFQAELAQDGVATLQRFAALVALGGEHSRPVARDLRAILAGQRQPDAAALAMGLELLAAIDYRSRLRGLVTPVLPLFAAEDALVPVAVAERVSGAQILPGGHAPMLGAPENLLASLAGFYRGLGVMP